MCVCVCVVYQDACVMRIPVAALCGYELSAGVPRHTLHIVLVIFQMLDRLACG